MRYLQTLSDGATTLSGVILLGSYLLLDSFTSTWQNALFVDYGVTSIQMMCAVNMFSCLLTAMSLFQQSSFPLIFSFMTTVIDFCNMYFCNSAHIKVALTTFIIQYPRFIIDCLLISICSASGQLYIFYTISKFGSITFVIMMTIRQVYNYLISIYKKRNPKNMILHWNNVCYRGWQYYCHAWFIITRSLWLECSVYCWCSVQYFYEFIATIDYVQSEDAEPQQT